MKWFKKFFSVIYDGVMIILVFCSAVLLKIKKLNKNLAVSTTVEKRENPDDEMCEQKLM